MPQLTAPESADTEPEPEPPLVTQSVHTGTKVAVTARAWVIVTPQVDVPVQPAPDHPAKRDPAEGEAVRVTGVPSS